MTLPHEGPTFDLQSHSVCSDGALEPAEVVRRAAAAGVELLALSDHDTVDGVDEACAAAAEHGLVNVPCAEISAVQAEHEDLHVLGYLVDHHDEAFRARLEHWRGDRARRAARMADRLRELGFAVDDAVLEERRAAGAPIGRPHLARAVVGHPDNAERLAAEGRTELTPFLVAYLTPGAPAFLSRSEPSVAEAIETIHAAGGVAVWAHPFWDVDDPAEVTATLRRFADVGLDGVEAFYVAHDRAQTLHLADAADELGLLTTGSADFHAPDHRNFSRFRAFALHGREPRLGPVDLRG